MALSNQDRLSLLDQVREQSGDWRVALEDLMEDAELAVVAEENEAFETARRTVEVPDDEDRWESAGTVVDRNGLHRFRDYRDTL